MTAWSESYNRVCGRRLKEFCPQGHAYAEHRAKSGKSTRCRKCTAERTTQWRQANPDTRKASERNTKLKLAYGITSAEYDAMLATQGGGCAICGSKPKTRRLNVDHDHKTGKVRGLLCYSCNYGLGMFRDKIERLQQAAEYLRRNLH